MTLPLERIYIGMLGVGTVGKSALTLQFMYDEVRIVSSYFLIPDYLVC